LNADGAGKNRAFIEPGASHDTTCGIHHHAESRIGAACKSNAVFNGAHSLHDGMLVGTARFAEPAVIRDIDKQIRAVLNALPDEIWENTLIADERRRPEHGCNGKSRASISPAKSRFGDINTRQYGKDLFKGHRFAEGNQPDFMVGLEIMASGINQKCSIVNIVAVI